MSAVETEEDFVELLSSAGCEGAAFSNATEPAFLEDALRADVVMGRARLDGACSFDVREKLREGTRGDAFAPMFPAEPERDLSLAVVRPAPYRTNDLAIDLDHECGDVIAFAEPSPTLVEGLAVARIGRRERRHAVRLRILPMREEDVEVGLSYLSEKRHALILDLSQFSDVAVPIAINGCLQLLRRRPPPRLAQLGDPTAPHTPPGEPLSESVSIAPYGRRRTRRCERVTREAKRTVLAPSRALLKL